MQSTACAAVHQTELVTSACSHSGCGILIADNEGTIQYVNARFTAITGYGGDEIIGKNPRVLQSGETARGTYLTLWNEISSGRTWRGTLRNRRKNGELFWESIVISPIFDEREAITHFVGVIDDVSEQVAAEEEAERLADELLQNEKWESFLTLTNGLAHDLNNLLTGVIAHADLALMRRDASTATADSLHNIRDAGQRASKLLGQLSQFLGGVPVTKAPLSLRALTRRYLHTYEAELPSILNLRWEPSIDDCLALGSESMLQQVLLELVRNAVHASYPGGTITVRCGRMPRESGSEPDKSAGTARFLSPVVYLEVEDQGAGIDPDRLARIFDPFFSTEPGGRGLGLTRALGVMIGHGGGIRVWTKHNQGTTVRLVLPALL